MCLLSCNPPRLCGDRAGWCPIHSAAVRGHVREQGRPVDRAANHWPANLEGCACRREAGWHISVASARPSSRMRSRVATPNQKPATGAGTVAARGRANHHRLHEDHPAGHSGGIGNAQRRGDEKKIHLPSPRGLKFWGEKDHETTVVALTRSPPFPCLSLLRWWPTPCRGRCEQSLP